MTLPLNCGVTLAVKVTDCPKFDRFRDEAKVVVVVALLTTWFTTFEVLPMKLASPPYTALMGWVPAGRVEVAKLAEPPLNLAAPNAFLLSTKETVSPFGGQRHSEGSSEGFYNAGPSRLVSREWTTL